MSGRRKDCRRNELSTKWFVDQIIVDQTIVDDIIVDQMK